MHLFTTSFEECIATIIATLSCFKSHLKALQKAIQRRQERQCHALPLLHLGIHDGLHVANTLQMRMTCSPQVIRPVLIYLLGCKVSM